jgi:hypothetical protein
LDLAALAAQRLRRSDVGRVARVVTNRVVFFIAEMMNQLAIERTFDERLRQLLEQTVLIEYVVQLLVIFQ